MHEENFDEKVTRLKAMLEVFVEQGVSIFKGGRLATVQDIVDTQMVMEDYNYVPEFIVKNESGEIKEIWYSDDEDHNK